MPLYVADYLGDTGDLSTLEHGAYMLLIMHYWQRRGLPKDDEKLARICRLDTESFAKAKLSIIPLFGKAWVHDRIDEELALADEKHAKRIAAGKKGGRPKGLAESKAKAKLSEEESNAKAKPNQSHSHSPISTEASASDGETPSSYPADPVERLWAEGIDAMLGMGATRKDAGSNIGRWLRDQKNDAVAVLGAIIRARAQGSKDPVPLVSRILKPLQGNGRSNDDRASRSVYAAAVELDGLLDSSLGFPGFEFPVSLFSAST